VYDFQAMKMAGLTKRGWCWDVVSCNSGENQRIIMYIIIFDR